MENIYSPAAHRRTAVPHQTAAPALELEDVCLAYNQLQVLDKLTLSITQGERVAVVGPNGAGKSSLFKVLSGVLQPASGKVRVFGAGPSRHICISYLPQRSQVDWNFPATVADVVLMGRVGKLGLFRQPGRADHEIVRRCLEAVSLENLSSRQISELSGGQQQRMFIARALAKEAEIILMDEPLNGLDAPSQEIIFHILDELRGQKVTVMVATHDLNLAAERFDSVLLLNRRLLAYGPARQIFTTSNLLAAYGGHVHMIEGAQGLMAISDTCCEEHSS